VAGDDFIFAVRSLSDDGRDKYPVGLYTLNGLFHLLIIPHLKRMIGKIMELGEGDVDDCADHIL
jgi:hypothetical protein